MNYADKMEQEARLKSNIADWMEAHGEVLMTGSAATLTPESESGKSSGEAAPTAL